MQREQKKKHSFFEEMKNLFYYRRKTSSLEESYFSEKCVSQRKKLWSENKKKGIKNYEVIFRKKCFIQKTISVIKVIIQILLFFNTL